MDSYIRLYNTIIVYDVYTIAENEDAARAAAIAVIRDQAEPEEPSEQTALEAREDKNVRAAWQAKRPIVGADVSDADFETLKGKTTTEAHAMIYKQIEPAK